LSFDQRISVAFIITNRSKANHKNLISCQWQQIQHYMSHVTYEDEIIDLVDFIKELNHTHYVPL